MRNFLQKISLRTRLILLTIFALMALLIAILSAFRTAQMSTVFAQRQTEVSVNAAVRELSRDARDIGKQTDQLDRQGNLLPHLREIYSQYQDEYSRTAAIALRRFENVSGGFCSNEGIVKGFIPVNGFQNDQQTIAEDICRNILIQTEFSQRKIQLNGKNIYVITSPVPVDKNAGIDISGVFAFSNLPESNTFSDRFNLLTQTFLLLSVVGLVVFSFLTLRQWRHGMLKIEFGLNDISQDLNSRIESPKIAELEQISNEINGLAGKLQINLIKRHQLETDLARSEKFAALGRVASGIAHEVRNPLAAMKLKVQLSERNNYDSKKLSETFRVLLEEIDRLDGLVKKLLDISRPTKLELADVSLAKLLKQRVSLVLEKAALQNITIQTDFPEDGFVVKIDAEKIAQVIDNLLLNGIEAMPNGGKLNVLIIEKEKFIELSISNNGEKIDHEAKEKIFEPFFTTKDKGTGLGLAISRELIEMHGGKIFLTENNSTEFVIELPKSEFI